MVQGGITTDVDMAGAFGQVVSTPSLSDQYRTALDQNLRLQSVFDDVGSIVDVKPAMPERDSPDFRQQIEQGVAAFETLPFDRQQQRLQSIQQDNIHLQEQVDEFFEALEDRAEPVQSDALSM